MLIQLQSKYSRNYFKLNFTIILHKRPYNMLRNWPDFGNTFSHETSRIHETAYNFKNHLSFDWTDKYYQIKMKRDEASWRRWPILIIFSIFCTNVSFQVNTSKVKQWQLTAILNRQSLGSLPIIAFNHWRVYQSWYRYSRQSVSKLLMTSLRCWSP